MNLHSNRPLLATLGLLATSVFGLANARHLGTGELTVYLPSDTGIVVVDPTEHRRIGNIVGTDNSHGLAITPDGSTLVAGSLLARAPDQAMPRPEGVSEQEHLAHHGTAKSDPPGTGKTLGTVYLVDVHAGEVKRRIEVPGAIHHTLVTPDGRYAVSTHPALEGVSIVNLATGNFERQVRTGPAPDYVVPTRDGERLFVSNSGDGTVSEIDTSTWKVVRQIGAGGSPGHLALSNSDAVLFVVDVAGASVVQVDITSSRVVQRYPAGDEPHGVALSDDESRLYVSSIQDNRLTAIDLATGAITSRVLDPAPYHVTTVPGTGKLYVSSRKYPRVWVVDQASLHIDGAIATDGITHQMVVRRTPRLVTQ